MRLKDLYSLAVKLGMAKDVRSGARLKQVMADARKEYKKAKGVHKSAFDKERFTNPYSDTRILYGDPDHEIKTVMVGIDMHTQELLLADRLREKGQRIDLVISHHPKGRALAGLYDVMKMQADRLHGLGLDQKIAEKLLAGRIGEVARSLHSGNHERSVEAARILKIPYMCIHTAADNHVERYLQKLFDKKKPKTVKQVLGILNAIPEYKAALKGLTGPRLITGKESDKAGKVFVDMSGGTGGPRRVFARLSQAGIGTIVNMHIGEASYKTAKSEYVNVIVAGHIASDNIGLNLLFDEIEKKDRIKIIPCSGFMRVRRK